jgi:hypothetical protein
MDRLETLDFHQYSRTFVLIHLLCCAAMFFIFVIFEYFWADFQSRVLRSFSSIHFVELGVRTSLIIYLHPWSESMTLAPSILWISPDSSNT